jgi:hypothetical protein
LAGLALGVVASVLLRSRRGEPGLRRNASSFFFVVAAVYPVIALWNGLPTLAVEAALALGACVLIVMTSRRLWVLGAIFALHAAWDFVHRRAPFALHVPGWYPVFCATLDVTFGAFLIARVAQSR